MRKRPSHGPTSRWQRLRGCSACMLLLMPLSAQAVAAPLARCAAIADDGQRLACYDDLARQSTQQDPVAAQTPVIGSEPASDPVAEFGRNAQMQEAPTEPEPTLSALTANIVEIAKRQRGERLFFLDNGQIWAETERKSGGNFRKGTAIEIRRGRFGGYRLFGSGNRGYRVERLK